MPRPKPWSHLGSLGILWLACALPLPLPGATGDAEQSPGILFRHGESVGEVQSHKDLALGTQAAWASAHDGLVFATAGFDKKLILRSWHLGEEMDRVLPVPPVKTDLELQWQWSFSPDGRWLAVRRWAHPRHLFPHGGDEKTREEAERVKWIGAIDLSTMEIQEWPQAGAIRGWRNGACVLSDGYNRPVVALEPSPSRKVEEMNVVPGILTNLSPDGRFAVFYDGREGNPRVTLQELGGAPLRVLYEESLERAKSYAKLGHSEGAFSPDNSWVAVTNLRFESDGWKTSVALESLDGKTRLFEDSFEIDGTDHMARTTWSPGGAQRFVYFRLRRGRPDGELVVVEVSDGRASAKSITLAVRPTESLFFPLLWSPQGGKVAWLVRDRGVAVCDLNTNEITVAGQLPSDATNWSWAAPRVGGVSDIR